jgi:hypothetical protein
VITTNYDRLIEQAYDNGDKKAVHIVNAMNAREQPKPDRVTIIKLHGDIQNPDKCILSKSQYDQAYGPDKLDMELPIPSLLSEHFKNSNLLFIGCSLNHDRTIEVFDAVKAQREEGGDNPPQHFTFEQFLEDREAFAERNSFLLGLGITPIWFEKDRFDYIEQLLSLLKHELAYRRKIESIPPSEIPDTKQNLNHFLYIFTELMPLMYWLHRQVPQAETHNYLSAMQRIFYIPSFVTEHTNGHLLTGLDHVLRPLSIQPYFNGYTHDKLTIAFRHFQMYLAEQGKQNELHNEFEWNSHEMLTIPCHQFEDLLTELQPTGLDYQAIRLIIALLQHGLKQERSPKAYCELPNTVNVEFAEYLSLALSLNLNLATPDRLDTSINDIHSACESAWAGVSGDLLEPRWWHKLAILLGFNHQKT